MMDVVDYTREFKYRSPRLVYYYGKYTTISPDLVEGQEVKSIMIDDELIEPRIIKANNKVFKCNMIFVDKYIPLNDFIQLSLYYTLLNKTSIYLLPTLLTKEENKVGKKALLYDTNFVNAYVKIDDTELDYNLYLLYRYDGSVNMGNLEEYFRSLKNYKETIQPDPYHSLYCFEVQDKLTYDTFLSSKFNKFSDEHKKKIENFHQLKSNDVWYQVIYDSDKLRYKLEGELGITIPKDVSLNEAIKLETETYDTTEMSINKYSEDIKL